MKITSTLALEYLKKNKNKNYITIMRNNINNYSYYKYFYLNS